MVCYLPRTVPCTGLNDGLGLTKVCWRGYAFDLVSVPESLRKGTGGLQAQHRISRSVLGVAGFHRKPRKRKYTLNL